MSFLIAITGKGGAGKTTVASLIVHRLIASGRRPVLAVDADPNNCLDLALGVRVTQTLGRVREEARQLAGKGMPAGVSKQELLQLKISESLVEADDFDLIAMGRPEGPGCYCYANNILKSALGEIAGAYPWVVLDNEAGLENLSRRIVQKVNLLVMVSDPSRAGLQTVGRLHALAREMGVDYDRLALVVNRMRGESPPPEAPLLQRDTGADWLVGLPSDDAIAALGEAGGSVRDLPVTNRVVREIDRWLAAIRS